MNPLARAVLDAVRDDADACAELAAALAPHIAPAAPPAHVAAYTVATLAAELGVTPKPIRNAIARGELAAVKRGGRWMIRPDAVARWATPAPRSSGAVRPRPQAASSAETVRAALSQAMGCDSVTSA
jgi:excisionase family DNA binding protein